MRPVDHVIPSEGHSHRRELEGHNQRHQRGDRSRDRGGGVIAMKFKVIRQHLGDKMYFPGDEREMREDEAAHLVPHVLRKMESAPKNKAEARAPKNKSDD